MNVSPPNKFPGKNAESRKCPFYGPFFNLPLAFVN